MSVLQFSIPGEPRGKGRPKFARRGAGVATYTDGKTAAYEGLVALAARQAMAGGAMIEGPLRVAVHAYFTPPRSASAKARAGMLANTVKPTKKPDLDNIVKAVLDGLQGVAFADDVTVTYISASKRYDPTPGVLVTVERDVMAEAASLQVAA